MWRGLPPALHHAPGRAHFGAFRVTPSSCRFTEDSGSRGTGGVPVLGLVGWRERGKLTCRAAERREGGQVRKRAMNRTPVGGGAGNKGWASSAGRGITPLCWVVRGVRAGSQQSRRQGASPWHLLPSLSSSPLSSPSQRPPGTWHQPLPIIPRHLGCPLWLWKLRLGDAKTLAVTAPLHQPRRSHSHCSLKKRLPREGQWTTCTTAHGRLL